MLNLAECQQRISEAGFAVINDVYTADELALISDAIDRADRSNASFRQSGGLFAIRRFLLEVSDVKPIIFNDRLTQTIATLFGTDYFPVKAIYFDKPEKSNWFVAYHQDLMISVDKKTDLPGFGPWTVKQNQYAVQPPLEILQKNFTIRIHLDDTDKANGALKVINGSHAKGIYRPETIKWKEETETVCEVKAGGVMMMRPLLLHASDRTTNNQKRRVIHIEFSNLSLPDGLNWAEVDIPG